MRRICSSANRYRLEGFINVQVNPVAGVKCTQFKTLPKCHYTLDSRCAFYTMPMLIRRVSGAAGTNWRMRTRETLQSTRSLGSSSENTTEPRLSSILWLSSGRLCMRGTWPRSCLCSLYLSPITVCCPPSQKLDFMFNDVLCVDPIITFSV